MFTKDIKFSILLDFYGDILSERQKEIMDYYYNDDLSLSEIADITGLTRQGTRDAIKKSENKLVEFETKLGLAERFDGIIDSIDDITNELQKLSDKNPSVSKELLEIANRLNSLKI